MARFRRQGIAKILRIQDQLLQLDLMLLSQFFPGSASVRMNSPVVPPRKRQATKTQHDFTVLRRGVHGDFLRRKLENRREGCGGAIDQELRFATRNKPRGNIAADTGIDFLEGFAELVEFKDLYADARIDTGEAVPQDSGLTFGQDQAQSGEGAGAGGLAGAFEPSPNVKPLSMASGHSPCGTARNVQEWRRETPRT